MANSPTRPAFLCTLAPDARRFPADSQSSLLDAALAAGLAVPFSCRRGECGSCRAQVMAGQHERIAPPSEYAYPVQEQELLLCQCRALSDLTLRFPHWQAPAAAAAPRTARVVSLEYVARTIARLVVEVQGGTPFDWQAGQHVRLGTEPGSLRCFSIANVPGEPASESASESAGEPAGKRRLEFHIRRLPAGLHRPRARHAGARRHAAPRRPRGRLRLACPAGGGQEAGNGADAGQDLVLLATGTGFAGVRPILLTARPVAPAARSRSTGATARRRTTTPPTGSTGCRHNTPPCAGSRCCPPAPPRRDGSRMPPSRAPRLGARTGLRLRPSRHGARRACRPARRRAAAGTLPRRGLRAGGGAAPSLGTGRAALQHDGPAGGAAPFDRGGQCRRRHAAPRHHHRRSDRHDRPATAGHGLRLQLASHLCALRRRLGQHWHQPSQRERRLRADDIVVIDVGPVWDGYEGDYGDTFVLGEDADHRRCAQAARAVFDAARRARRHERQGAVCLRRDARARARLRTGGGRARPPRLRNSRTRCTASTARPTSSSCRTTASGCWRSVRDRARPIGAFFEDVLVRA